MHHSYAQVILLLEPANLCALAFLSVLAAALMRSEQRRPAPVVVRRARRRAGDSSFTRRSF